MPIVPLFTASQTIGQAAIITLNDTSTGSDAAITSRAVFLQKQDGTYLVPAGTLTNYIVWPYANPTISINALLADMALVITVNWLNVSGTVLYTKSNLYVFTLYEEQFDYTLISTQVADQNKVNDTYYYMNRIKLRIAINDAKNAVSLASSITDSQAACDRGMYLVNNSSLFF